MPGAPWDRGLPTGGGFAIRHRWIAHRRRKPRAFGPAREGGRTGLETFKAYDIERAVGEDSYLRGLDYFRRGMVRSVEFGAQGRIHGEVSGSQPKPYAVVAKYESASDGKLVPVDGQCSCTAGYNCKHAAAVLLSAMRISPDGVAGTAREGVSRDVRRWLDGCPGAAPADSRPAGPTAPGPDHLYYVFRRDAADGMRIDPYRAHVKQDGAIGRNFREYREGAARGKFLTAEDAAFAGRLGHYEEDVWPPRYAWQWHFLKHSASFP